MTDLSVSASELDWEQLTSDTRYLTHGIHRYSGKFIPQIAGQAIDLTTAPGDLVLDPYVGSGTTLLESALRGRRSIGLDLNPVACLISRVKVTPVDADTLDNFASRLNVSVRAMGDGEPTLPGLGLFLAGDMSLNQAESSVYEDWRWSDPWFVKWFPDPRRRELLMIDQLIQAEPLSDLRAIAQVAMSDVLRVSSMANTSYPNVMYDRRKSPPPTVLPRFLRRFAEVVAAVRELESKVPPELVPPVLDASACNVPLPDEHVDAIVTHPPYIGSIPYAEYGLLTLKWLGHDPRRLDDLLTGGRRQARDVVNRFERDFAMMIAEAARVLRSGRHLVMLLGSPTVKGQVIDLPTMALDFSATHGFRLDAKITRRGGNRRANMMAEEELLFLRKP